MDHFETIQEVLFSKHVFVNVQQTKLVHEESRSHKDLPVTVKRNLLNPAPREPHTDRRVRVGHLTSFHPMQGGGVVGATKLCLHGQKSAFRLTGARMRVDNRQRVTRSLSWSVSQQPGALKT